MWNGHRMLRHRGHRDELTADLLSKRRDNYPGNFICLPRFLPPSSKYFQSLLDDRLSSSFCFLFVPPSRFFSRLSWLDANILLPILRLSNFRIGFFRFFFFFFFFLPLFFFCRLFFDDYTWPKGKSYRTTDNYIFRHARLLWRIMEEWVFLEKSWGDSRWRGIFHEGVARVNNWLLVVSRSKGSQRRGRDWWDSSVLHDTVL